MPMVKYLPSSSASAITGIPAASLALIPGNVYVRLDSRNAWENSTGIPFAAVPANCCIWKWTNVPVGPVSAGMANMDWVQVRCNCNTGSSPVKPTIYTPMPDGTECAKPCNP